MYRDMRPVIDDREMLITLYGTSHRRRISLTILTENLESIPRRMISIR